MSNSKETYFCPECRKYYLKSDDLTVKMKIDDYMTEKCEDCVQITSVPHSIGMPRHLISEVT